MSFLVKYNNDNICEQLSMLQNRLARRGID